MHAAGRIQLAVQTASQNLVEREALCELVALAAVAGEHVLIIGPPGTGKSEAVRRVARTLGASTFEYLLGRFTEPNELFGPVDLLKLREGVVESRTEGMLPEAEFAFLDEVFLGSTAILNTLLGVLADRTFRRGHTDMTVPLRVCVGASNGVPTEPSLAAFADRFVLRAWVAPVGDDMLEEMLTAGWGLGEAPEAVASVADLDELATTARAMDPSAIRVHIAHAVRSLRSAGVELSDRRVVKLQRLCCAAAALAGRDAPTTADLWPIVYAVPDEAGQRLARDTLREQLADSDNAALPAAAAEASLSDAARAGQLVVRAQALLEEGDDAPDRALRAEALLRQIDATVREDARPEALEALRDTLVALVG